MKTVCFLSLLLFIGTVVGNIDDVSSRITNGIILPIEYNLQTSDTHQGMDCLKIAVDP